VTKSTLNEQLNA